ncbi:MAG TPA: MerR family transcriptional regulator [Blastocatellia bacterium]|nr:MerR family transcriptional regulator [Blastocatellia bacterium]
MEAATRIPEKLFFRIGEVCELIKVQPHVLRYWETEFPMLTPHKNRAGQRVYRRKDVEMVMRIRDLLYEEKFTIAGAKRKLMSETRSPAARDKALANELQFDEEPESPLTPAQSSVSATPTGPSPASPPTSADQSASLQARIAIRVIKRELEDLLTLLNSDASIRA